MKRNSVRARSIFLLLLLSHACANGNANGKSDAAHKKNAERKMVTFPPGTSSEDVWRKWQEKGLPITASATAVKSYGRRLLLMGLNATMNTTLNISQALLNEYNATLEDDNHIALFYGQSVWLGEVLDPNVYTAGQYSNESKLETFVGNITYDDAWAQELLISMREMGVKCSGTRVAILDSGLSPQTLANFMHDMLGGYDWITDTYVAGDGDGRDPEWLEPDPIDLGCSHWHGSRIAQLLAGYDGKDVVRSVCPSIQISPQRVLGDCGVGFASDVADALVWSAGGDISGLGVNEHPSTVAVMAFAGVGSCPSFLQSAVYFAVSRGMTVIAAAGNDGGDIANYFPANCDGVVTVGSLEQNGTVAAFSNRPADVYFYSGVLTQPIRCLDGDMTMVACVGTSYATVMMAALIATTGLEFRFISNTSIADMFSNQSYGGFDYEAYIPGMPNPTVVAQGLQTPVSCKYSDFTLGNTCANLFDLDYTTNAYEGTNFNTITLAYTQSSQVNA